MEKANAKFSRNPSLSMPPLHAWREGSNPGFLGILGGEAG
jgi:hypothetical protein